MITPEIRNSPFFTICCCVKMRLELLQSLLLWKARRSCCCGPDSL
eukprot:COSAG05_NODE_728_length_7700_cov_14.555979_2_plen_45_part_00